MPLSREIHKKFSVFFKNFVFPYCISRATVVYYNYSMIYYILNSMKDESGCAENASTLLLLQTERQS